MYKKINVLVFPAGEINSVELHAALSTSVNIRLYGASSTDRHGPYIYKNYIGGLPNINEDVFLVEFNKLLKKYEIDVIFPTHDSVVKYLSDNRDKLSAKLIAGDEKTSEICRDKQKTFEMFSDCSFCPKIYIDFKKIDFPVFIKPKQGQGSVGALKVRTAREFNNYNLSDYVVCEYLPGQEYTVDCLTDRNGELKVVSPRSRDRTMAGVSTSAKNQTLTDEIRKIANIINTRLTFKGLWFFQIKKGTNGKFKLLEISTRCAGTMCLTRALGANLPLLSVYTAMGIDVEAILNPYNVQLDRTLINRYKINYDYDTVYLDFDDTVIIDNKVHLYSIMFIYQCKNQGKKIVLLTRHKDDISKTLIKYKINIDLFDEIIKLEEKDFKYIKIQPEKSIFVDNAFKERKEVYKKYKIPVFDVDMLEVLLDWKI